MRVWGHPKVRANGSKCAQLRTITRQMKKFVINQGGGGGFFNVTGCEKIRTQNMIGSASASTSTSDLNL